MPEARAAATCFTGEQTAYVAFGRNAKNEPQSTILTYSPDEDQWGETLSTPLKARVNACACAHEQYIYVGLGFDGSHYQRADSAYLTDWWRYDPKTNTWQELAPYPNHRTDRAVAFATDDAIYVGYGFQTNYTRDMFRYDIELNRWDSVDVHVGEHDYPKRSFGGAGASYHGRMFYGTGYRQESLEWWAELLPEGRWEKRCPVPGGGVTLAAAAATDTYILLIGGQHVGGVGTNGRIERTIRGYDPETDSWFVIGQLPEARLNHCAFTYGTNVYCVGGDDANFRPTSTLWQIQLCND